MPQIMTTGDAQALWEKEAKVAEAMRAFQNDMEKDEPSLPDTLDVDEHGYPSDERLDQIERGDSIGPAGARWLVEMFPKLAESLAPYAHCEVLEDFKSINSATFEQGDLIKIIKFSTGGWSGCEDLIAAVLKNTMLRALYHSEWRRGGHFTFIVPVSALGAK